MTYAELAHFTSNACAHCAAREEAQRLRHIAKQTFATMLNRRQGGTR